MTDFYDPRTRDLSLSRRPQNRRDDVWIRALLARLTVGRVGTVWTGEDGGAWPFVTPLAFAYRPETHDIVYHTNVVGRLRANTDQNAPSRTVFEASEIGHLLPSNDPLELTVQYRSVMAFGTARVLTDREEAREALRVLSERAFPGLRVGESTRPIRDADLIRTTVYSLAVERWSGKENWAEAAAQTEAWPVLPPDLASPRSTTLG
ncbi:pyridoxamine 5'-phosphate oxidase family protein [Deinococcus hopiensis]|uniref:Nitroimidazol reductase NimA, pyridoxamine 5'-phosphate oxidase superfamily n=1 Tax=Deinococcus hopiensis KR-140 TaxID=695939 RepID=A0A1W1VD46_9DEIO|nr:pyridoxamine 5'-phosphate oxidase family protein [Deinococcus hopiensis]SMB90874.1 hypothetical protein SAMN00790413_00921 [Deinococcus hopiensis KR-140]